MLLIYILLFTPLLAGDQTIEAYSLRQASLVITADATFTANYFPITSIEAYTISGTGVLTTTSLTDQLKNAMMTDIAKTVAITYPNVVFNYLMNFYTQYSIYFNIYAVISYAYTIYQEFVVSDHTKERGYFFTAPADGMYRIDVWVPGDINKPASIVDIVSHTSSGDNIRLHYDSTHVSDRTLSFNIFCYKGINSIKVKLGSGSVLTHNCGHLSSVALDDPVTRTWVADSIPTNVMQITLIDHLPTVGSSASFSVPFNPAPINPGASVIYSNIQAKIFSTPLPPDSSISTIDIYCQPTPSQLDQLGTTTTISLDFLGSTSYTNGYGYFTLTRTSDFYSIHTVCEGMWTPCD